MGFMTEKFEKLKQESNLKAFLFKDEINEKSKELRKLEAKKTKTEEDEKKIRRIQQETEQLALRQQQAQQMVNRASLGEKILQYYFAYKITALLCNTFLDYNRDRYNSGDLAARIEDELQEKVSRDEIDIPTARAEQIEQIRDQFISINNEAKEIGICQYDIFTQQDRDNLTDLAVISRDTNNPHQIELYAAKCEELGLNKNEAFQAFQQDKNIEIIQREVENNKNQREQECSHEIEI